MKHVVLHVPDEIEQLMRRVFPLDTLPIADEQVRIFLVGIVAGLFVERGDEDLARRFTEANPIWRN